MKWGGLEVPNDKTDARPAPYQLRTLSVPTLSLCIVCKVCSKLCKELALIVSRDNVLTTILLFL